MTDTTQHQLRDQEGNYFSSAPTIVADLGGDSPDPVGGGFSFATAVGTIRTGGYLSVIVLFASGYVTFDVPIGVTTEQWVAICEAALPAGAVYSAAFIGDDNFAAHDQLALIVNPGFGLLPIVEPITFEDHMTGGEPQVPPALADVNAVGSEGTQGTLGQLLMDEDGTGIDSPAAVYIKATGEANALGDPDRKGWTRIYPPLG